MNAGMHSHIPRQRGRLCDHRRWFICLWTSTRLFVRACLRPSACLPVCPSVRPSVRPSVCLSACLSVCTPVCLSFYQQYHGKRKNGFWWNFLNRSDMIQATGNNEWNYFPCYLDTGIFLDFELPWLSLFTLARTVSCSSNKRDEGMGFLGGSCLWGDYQCFTTCVRIN